MLFSALTYVITIIAALRRFSNVQEAKKLLVRNFTQERESMNDDGSAECIKRNKLEKIKKRDYNILLYKSRGYTAEII